MWKSCLELNNSIFFIRLLDQHRGFHMALSILSKYVTLNSFLSFDVIFPYIISICAYLKLSLAFSQLSVCEIWCLLTKLIVSRNLVTWHLVWVFASMLTFALGALYCLLLGSLGMLFSRPWIPMKISIISLDYALQNVWFMTRPEICGPRIPRRDYYVSHFTFIYQIKYAQKNFRAFT